MCGRYASARKRIELLEEFRVDTDRAAEPLEPDYNVAPTKPVYAVLSRVWGRGEGPAETGTGSRAEGGAGDGQPDSRAGGETGPPAGSRGTSAGAEVRAESGRRGHGGEVATRQLRVLRWGLVPSWAKDPSIGGRMINARAETVDSKPAYRKAFARRRCLLPADGYYEWQPGKVGSRTIKQPYFISRRDGGSLAMAGIYELWRDRDVPDDHERAWLWTAAIITTDAPDELGQIHDRMPMIIGSDHWSDWLDPANDNPADLRELLTPAVAGGLVWHPVSTQVNSVRHNGPELIEPIELDAAAGHGSGDGSG